MRSSEVRGPLTGVQTTTCVCNMRTVPKLSAQYGCTILLDHFSPHVQHPKLMIKFSKSLAQIWYKFDTNLAQVWRKFSTSLDTKV